MQQKEIVHLGRPATQACSRPYHLGSGHIVGLLEVSLLSPVANPDTGPAACLVIVRASDGNPDTRDVTSFYKLWEAFTAIHALCVRFYKIGHAYGLGKLAALHELSSSRARKRRLTGALGANQRLSMDVAPF